MKLWRLRSLLKNHLSHPRKLIFNFFNGYRFSPLASCVLWREPFFTTMHNIKAYEGLSSIAIYAELLKQVGKVPVRWCFDSLNNSPAESISNPFPPLEPPDLHVKRNSTWIGVFNFVRSIRCRPGSWGWIFHRPYPNGERCEAFWDLLKFKKTFLQLSRYPRSTKWTFLFGKCLLIQAASSLLSPSISPRGQRNWCDERARVGSKWNIKATLMSPSL